MVVPHVDTAEQAREVVDAGKFAPIGHRGNYGGRQSFGVEDYLTRANDETLLVVLIEDVVAIENLDRDPDGGPNRLLLRRAGDLSQSMGLPGGMNNPEVQRVVDDAVERIIAAGRVAGSLASIETVEETIEKGARLLLTNWDPWVAAGARTYLKKAGGG